MPSSTISRDARDRLFHLLREYVRYPLFWLRQRKQFISNDERFSCLLLTVGGISYHEETARENCRRHWRKPSWGIGLRYAGHWLAKVLIYSILIYMTMIKQYIRMMQTRVGQIYLPTSFASWAFKPHI